MISRRSPLVTSSKRCSLQPRHIKERSIIMKEVIIYLSWVAFLCAAVFFGFPLNQPNYNDCRVNNDVLTCAVMWWR
jgi:hypothetical protein